MKENDMTDQHKNSGKPSIHLLASEAEFGTYNLSGEGEVMSWADVAKTVYELTGHDASVVTPVTTEEYFAGKDGVAPRPLQSALDLTKIEATGFTPEPWQTALDTYLQTLE